MYHCNCDHYLNSNKRYCLNHVQSHCISYPQMGGSMSKPCDYDTDMANYTMCPHVLQVPLGSIVQLVISITISNAGK